MGQINANGDVNVSKLTKKPQMKSTLKQTQSHTNSLFNHIYNTKNNNSENDQGDDEGSENSEGSESYAEETSMTLTGPGGFIDITQSTRIIYIRTYHNVFM